VVFPDAVLVGAASCTIATTPANFQYANFSATLLLPQLQIQLAEANVLLSWPTNAPGFSLQTTLALPSGAWNAVTNMPIPSGGMYQVRLPASGSASFYRLIH
jgi:hypothetical protein